MAFLAAILYKLVLKLTWLETTKKREKILGSRRGAWMDKIGQRLKLDRENHYIKFTRICTRSGSRIFLRSYNVANIFY